MAKPTDAKRASSESAVLEPGSAILFGDAGTGRRGPRPPTAKTILVQLHHKVQTFEGIGRHLVLVTQSELLDYLRANFAFDHVAQARAGDAMQFHAYCFEQRNGAYTVGLESRLSTDADGVGTCLGLKAEPRIEAERIVAQLERKLSTATLLRIG